MLLYMCTLGHFPWDYRCHYCNSKLKPLSENSRTLLLTRTWAKIPGISWPFRDLWQLWSMNVENCLNEEGAEYKIISKANRLTKKACNSNISLYTLYLAKFKVIVIDIIFSNFSWFGSNAHCYHF